MLATSRTLIDASRTVQLAAFRSEPLSFVHEAGSYAVRGASVSTGYFDTLDLRITQGRVFTEAESRLGPGGLVAVISERLWRQQFSSATDTVGRSVLVNGLPTTIVGVAPRDFQGVWLAEATDVWLPMTAYARLRGEEAALSDPGSPSTHGMVGRLAPGMSLSEAQAELNSIVQRLERSEPSHSPRQAAVLLPYTGIAARDNVLARFGPRFLSIVPSSRC